MKKIAILLTCYNRKDKTLRCLSNIKTAIETVENVKCSIFLVDDASTDGTGLAVTQQYPEVNVIQGNGNLFWNRGMFLAWSEAEKKNFDFYLWLNDDTFLFESSLQTLLLSSERMLNQAIIVGSTCSEKTKMVSYGGRTSNGVLLVPNGKVQQCTHINGNTVLVPRYVYSKVGKLDPIFHHAIGDFEYGLRAKMKGISSYIASDFIGYCEDHEKLPKWCLPEISVTERFKALYSPLGNSHPYYFFLYERRHFGVLLAVKHFFSIHLRALIPSLWK